MWAFSDWIDSRNAAMPCDVTFVRRNSAGSCGACATSYPSIVNWLASTSYSRWISFTKLVFPDPDDPTGPTRSPPWW